MADDIKIQPSTGATDPSVATDEVAGRHYQIVKLAIGADGTATLIGADGLPISAAALPLPAGASTEATLAALKAVVDSLLTSAQAIETAAAAINSKTTAVNTGAIGGTVALDSATLAALETINANTSGEITGISPGFNSGILPVEILGGEVQTGDTGLRGALGAGSDAAAGTDAGNFSLISLFKRLLGKIPSLGQATMAASQPVVIASNQTAVPVTGSFSASFTPDDTAALMSAMRALVHPIWEEVATGRLRVVLDPTGGAQTLGTVTTVTTVTTCATLTNAAQMGGVPMNSFVYDQMHLAWASTVRRAVS